MGESAVVQEGDRRPREPGTDKGTFGGSFRDLVPRQRFGGPPWGLSWRLTRYPALWSRPSRDSALGRTKRNGKLSRVGVGRKECGGYRGKFKRQ